MKTKKNKIVLLTIFIIATLITGLLHAQDNVSVSVFQDVKLATIGDDKRGYDAFTLNTVIRFKMQGNQSEYGYFVVAPEFEYAELEVPYKRWSVNVGYTFNQLILDNVEVTPMINYGWIDRGVSTFSGGASLETMYKINDTLKIGILQQLTHRTDLPNNKIGYSLMAGLEINLK